MDDAWRRNEGAVVVAAAQKKASIVPVQLGRFVPVALEM